MTRNIKLRMPFTIAGIMETFSSICFLCIEHCVVCNTSLEISLYMHKKRLKKCLDLKIMNGQLICPVVV